MLSRKTTRKFRIISALTALAIFISIFTALNVSAEIFSGVDWSFDSDEGILTVESDRATNMWRNERGGNFQVSDVTTVIIEDSVTEIGTSAFIQTSITTITIPESVINIGESALANCTNLTSITVAPGNSNYSSIGGVLFNENATELVQYPIGNARTSYTIPSGVTSIGQAAFVFSSLTSVIIPKSVTSIGNDAFVAMQANSISITFNSQTPPIFGFSVFGLTPYSNVTIYVPIGAKAEYEAVGQLSYFTIHELPAPAIHDDDDNSDNNNRGGSSVRDAIISGGGIGGAAGSVNSSGKTEISGHFENDTYIKHSEIPLVYTADKNFADFREVRINGRRLTKGTHYTVKGGSTIITLLPEYLDTLDEGEHELSVHFSGLAVVRASFTVEEAEHDDVSTLAGILGDFDSIDN
ncbi:MAG: leucine-rich repeat protein [Oscillospiraceae bacterium]|nr:leucine-rich repeat protein [Oscillospiraceae bacterium]